VMSQLERAARRCTARIGSEYFARRQSWASCIYISPAASQDLRELVAGCDARLYVNL
jgi:hypothetical protein